MPPAVGRLAAISAMESETMNEKPPIMVQLAKAACGPPLYMAKPKSTGMPETKFMVVKVAAQFSNMPKERMKTCL